MNKFLGLSAAAVMSAAALTGCGGGTDEYCSSLEDTVAEFEALENGDFAGANEALGTFRDLADEAPSEVEDQWAILVDGFDQLEAALEDAGVTFEDLSTLQGGELPEGVDQEALAELPTVLEELGTEEFETAGDEIAEHADSECGVTLPG